MTTPYPHVLQALGHSARAMRYSLLGVAILLPLFYLGSHWGLVGVAAGWILGYPIVVAPMLHAVLEASELSGGDYFDALRAPLHASLVMGAVVMAVRTLMPSGWAVGSQLALAVTVGVLSYAAIMLGPYRARLATMKALAREFRR